MNVEAQVRITTEGNGLALLMYGVEGGLFQLAVRYEGKLIPVGPTLDENNVSLLGGQLLTAADNIKRLDGVIARAKKG